MRVGEEYIRRADEFRAAAILRRERGQVDAAARALSSISELNKGLPRGYSFAGMVDGLPKFKFGGGDAFPDYPTAGDGDFTFPGGRHPKLTAYLNSSLKIDASFSNSRIYAEKSNG